MKLKDEMFPSGADSIQGGMWRNKSLSSVKNLDISQGKLEYY